MIFISSLIASFISPLLIIGFSFSLVKFWFTFLKDLAEKTRSPLGSSRKLKRAIRNATNRPEIFISVGIHGNILFSDTGYCEFDDPAHAWKFIEKWAKISSGCSQNSKKSNQQTCFPIGFEIGICTLEELSKKYPIWKLLHDNHVEIINSLYSQPYLRHIGEESNFRQFLIGLETLSKNNLSCHVFFSSEHSLHPQLPQLLKGFNIELAFATNRLGGASPTTNRPKVIWIGKDDTEITSIVSQSGISNGQIWHGKFFRCPFIICFNIAAAPYKPLPQPEPEKRLLVRAKDESIRKPAAPFHHHG